MENPFRLLFIGDVIGPVGRKAILALVPDLRRELALDAVVVNGENSADNGFGITTEIAKSFLSVADFLTLGDHAFDQEEAKTLLEQEPRIIRPAGAPLDERRLRAEASAIQAVADCAPFRSGAPLWGRKTYRFAFAPMAKAAPRR